MPRSRGRFLLQMVLFLGGLSFTSTYGQEKQDTFVPFIIRFEEIEPPVVAQANITAEAPTSNQKTELKPLECSSLAWLNDHLLITSDRHEHLIFTCSLDLEIMDIGKPQPWVVVNNEKYLLKDVESLTLLNDASQISLYMMCSLSNDPDAQPLPQRRYLFKSNLKSMSPFEFYDSSILSMTSLREQLETCFESIKAQPYYTYNANYLGEDKNTYRWGNVEGITFTPDRQLLLCGMRNPLFDGAAIVFTLSGIPSSTEELEPKSLKVTDFFLLDLEDRGISDLTWDSVTEGYLITAGKSNGPRLNPNLPYPPNTLDSALFWWSGHKMDAPVLIARFPDFTVEAVCRLGPSRYIAIGSDEGDVSEGRTARQSIVTVLEFTGVPDNRDY